MLEQSFSYSVTHATERETEGIWHTQFGVREAHDLKVRRGILWAMKTEV